MSFASSPAGDPLPGFRFAVSFGAPTSISNAPAAALGALARGGVVSVAAGFSEVSGLGATLDIHTYAEGGVNDRVHKFVTRADYGNVTLRRGVVLKPDLFDWVHEVRRGSFGARRAIQIVHLDAAGRAGLVWYLHGALPASYVGPSWDAGQSAIAIEALEVAHEGLELHSGSSFALDFSMSVR